MAMTNTVHRPNVKSWTRIHGPDTASAFPKTAFCGPCPGPNERQPETNMAVGLLLVG